MSGAVYNTVADAPSEMLREELQMTRGSEELTNARKEEIIRACASLYKAMSFKDITIKEIGAVIREEKLLNGRQSKESLAAWVNSLSL